MVHISPLSLIAIGAGLPLGGYDDMFIMVALVLCGDEAKAQIHM